MWIMAMRQMMMMQKIFSTFDQKRNEIIRVKLMQKAVRVIGLNVRKAFRRKGLNIKQRC